MSVALESAEVAMWPEGRRLQFTIKVRDGIVYAHKRGYDIIHSLHTSPANQWLEIDAGTRAFIDIDKTKPLVWC